MKQDTREEILKVAKQLFNERGYNNVSIGDIANSLNISKGNLTYYFKKKEEIIETLLLETPKGKERSVPENLSELNNFFKDIQKTVEENAFYFWHYSQLAQISSTIEKMQDTAFNETILILNESFKILKNTKIIRDEQYLEEYKRVVDTLLLTSIYWIPFSKLKKTTSNVFIDQAWSIIIPFLTKKGLEELANMDK